LYKIETANGEKDRLGSTKRTGCLFHHVPEQNSFFVEKMASAGSLLDCCPAQRRDNRGTAYVHVSWRYK